MGETRVVRRFLVVTALFAAPGLFAVAFTGRPELHAAINASLPVACDPLFRYGTHLADGLVPTGIAVVLLLTSTWRRFLMLGLSTAISALVVQFLKRNVFGDMLRPVEHLSSMPELRLIDGVELNHHFSFPSGHSTAAYAMCLALAVLSGRVRWAGWLAVGAAFMAFSRVYLSQHFTEDILAGAFLGTVTAWAVHRWLYGQAMMDRTGLDRRPVGLLAQKK